MKAAFNAYVDRELPNIREEVPISSHFDDPNLTGHSFSNLGYASSSIGSAITSCDR